HEPGHITLRTGEGAAHNPDCSHGKADCHRRLTHLRACTALANVEVLKPAAKHGRRSVHHIVRAGNLRHGGHGKMTTENQIAGKPSDHEIEEVVTGKMTDRCAPEGTLLQYFLEANGRRTKARISVSVARHPLDPGRKPQQTDEPDSNECGTPAIFRY